MTKVSFIMPAWKVLFLHSAIESILRQTYEDIELVVVDDCSPQDIKSIVDSFGDPRISYRRNEVNIGGRNLVEQWNHCIKYAAGEYIVLASDDDTYSPDYCETCVRLAEKYPDVDIIRSAVEQIDGKGNHLWDDSILKEYTSRDEFIRDWFDNKAFTCIGNYMFRRKALEEIGGFISFPCAFGSDIATPFALAWNGVANTQKMLFQFRQTDVHLSSDTSKFPEKLEAISQLTEWFMNPDNNIPVSRDFLHRRCLFDYFNLVIRHLPMDKIGYLKYCRLASAPEKAMMSLRWIKTRITK